ncbi:amino acid carrier protein [Heliobacterium gestii]|uniref:Amino acid carrier protein n=2 Tax=Heliomicrobium gestii TaxID=2699 RepID=A0A845LA67_HELGE|nr:sodium:alanine symporter family protein [Heliomicrobium gestii]MBM7865580.1 AGCS family alanine or glycine:cation symporter [Heliomicrobium gestii]MZP41830.1 amino acid carrier protein [Heliomicrobium gestii]
MDMIQLLDQIDSLVWGPPLLILLVGTGIFLTARLGLLQVTRLPLALRLIFTAKNDGDGDVNSFGALCTALAATVGTGNIVGVATAIKAGGPGALFWMWMAAFFGMATKYAEGLLAVKYRSVDANGQISGGPMYYIVNGLGGKYKPLAIMFAASGVLVACFGIGTFPQVNSIVTACESGLGVPIPVTAAVITVLVALITLGGLQSIATVSEKIVPFMAIFYVVISVGVLAIFADQLPHAIQLVISNAFTGSAAAGGFLGATVMMAIRNGVARGVFSNESGLGSAPIAAAAAKTKWPAEQGLISMTGTFIDTIIICTMTGLVLIVTGVWSGDLAGSAMTQAAFAAGFPLLGTAMLTLGLALFAFTTILGWNYYGERCCEYLFGVKAIMPYRIIFILLVAVGAFLKLEAIWLLADIVNGLMAIPNLIALLGLSGVVVAETNRYLHHLRAQEKGANDQGQRSMATEVAKE